MEPYARYLPSRTFTYMAGSLGLAVLLVIGASLLSRDPAPGNLVAITNDSATSQSLTKLIQERIAAQKESPPTSDWEKEFNSITSKPLNPKTDLSSSTLTDLLARSLFTQFAAAQNGGELDAAAQQKVIDDTLGKITLRFTTYSEKDIRVGTDNSSAALKEYGNAIGKLIRDNSSTNTNEAVILSQALAQNDPKGLQGLSPIATSYHNLFSASLRLSVPPAAAKAHLSLVNSLGAIGDSVDAMAVAFQDPVRTVLYINKYEENAMSLYNSFVQLASLFKSSGVAFSSNDTGSVVMSLGAK